MDEMTIVRAASISAYAAIPAIIVAGVAFALFFGGKGESYGPINDLFTALTLLLLVLPAYALSETAGPSAGAWFPIVSWAAIAGMALAAAGQLLLIVGVISLQTSFVTGGVGILPVVAWGAAVSFLSLDGGTFPAVMGWPLLLILILSLGLAIGSMTIKSPLHPVNLAFTVGLLLALCGWFWVVGAHLAAQAEVSRIESGEIDLRSSTLERYALAVGQDIRYQLSPVRG